MRAKCDPVFLKTRQRLAAPLKESFKMYTTAKGRVVYLFYRLAQQKSMRVILEAKEPPPIFGPSVAIVKNPINSIYAISIYISDNGILINYIIQYLTPKIVKWVRKLCFAQNAERNLPATKNSVPNVGHCLKHSLLISVRRLPTLKGHNFKILCRMLGPGNREIRDKPPMRILI